MNCSCRSKQLYKTDYTHPDSSFLVDDRFTPQRRNYTHAPLPAANTHAANTLLEAAQLWTPHEISRVSWHQIQATPMQFYQKFIARNTPCIITDVLEGDDIFQRWADTQYLKEILDQTPFNVSLTPDGFADSIRGEYFIEPEEKTGVFSKLLNREDYFPGAVPYVQHQNDNLSKEFSTLEAQMPRDIVKNVSNSFFRGKNPDAQNLWLGFDQSVSSLHKDPYENFYLPIVGEKHFTILPPTSILALDQGVFQSAKWEYDNSQFKCKSRAGNNYWVVQNPDLDEDLLKNEGLSKCPKWHVLIQKGEMLYLPSLWYHQVSQCRGKQAYTMAVNYWFDMDFGPNYGLYETCRALRGLK